MKTNTVSNESASITITRLKDFAVWGSWSGDQSAAMDLIAGIEGIKSFGIALYREDGRAAGDNTSEGEFSGDAFTRAWDALQARFGKELEL